MNPKSLGGIVMILGLSTFTIFLRDTTAVSKRFTVFRGLPWYLMMFFASTLLFSQSSCKKSKRLENTLTMSFFQLIYFMVSGSNTFFLTIRHSLASQQSQVSLQQRQKSGLSRGSGFFTSLSSTIFLVTQIINSFIFLMNRLFSSLRIQFNRAFWQLVFPSDRNYIDATNREFISSKSLSSRHFWMVEHTRFWKLQSLRYNWTDVKALVCSSQFSSFQKCLAPFSVVVSFSYFLDLMYSPIISNRNTLSYFWKWPGLEQFSLSNIFTYSSKLILQLVESKKNHSQDPQPGAHAFPQGYLILNLSSSCPLSPPSYIIFMWNYFTYSSNLICLASFFLVKNNPLKRDKSQSSTCGESGLQRGKEALLTILPTVKSKRLRTSLSSTQSEWWMKQERISPLLSSLMIVSAELPTRWDFILRLQTLMMMAGSERRKFSMFEIALLMRYLRNLDWKQILILIQESLSTILMSLQWIWKLPNSKSFLIDFRMQSFICELLNMWQKEMRISSKFRQMQVQRYQNLTGFLILIISIFSFLRLMQMRLFKSNTMFSKSSSFTSSSKSLQSCPAQYSLFIYALMFLFSIQNLLERDENFTSSLNGWICLHFPMLIMLLSSTRIPNRLNIVMTKVLLGDIQIYLVVRDLSKLASNSLTILLIFTSFTVSTISQYSWSLERMNIWFWGTAFSLQYKVHRNTSKSLLVWQIGSDCLLMQSRIMVMTSSNSVWLQMSPGLLSNNYLRRQGAPSLQNSCFLMVGRYLMTQFLHSKLFQTRRVKKQYMIYMSFLC